MSNEKISEIHTDEDLKRIDVCLEILAAGSNCGAATQNALTLFQLVLMDAIECGQKSPSLGNDGLKTVETAIAETLRDLADNLEAGRFRAKDKK